MHASFVWDLMGLFSIVLQAHVMLHMLRGLEGTITNSNVEDAVAESTKRTYDLYDSFKEEAKSKVKGCSHLTLVYSFRA